MAALLTSLVAGAAFGLALAAPPGPMNAVIADESVTDGWGAGFRAGLGAMSADAVFFVLSLYGLVAVVERVPTLRAVMVAAGGVLMLYFARGAAADAGASFRSDASASGAGFRRAFVLALTNPYQILFWLTLGVGLLRPGTLDVLGAAPYVGGHLAGTLVVETGSPALLAGFFLGILCWITAFPAALVAAERRAETLAPVVSGASALVLAGFGLLFLSRAARTLVG